MKNIIIACILALMAITGCQNETSETKKHTESALSNPSRPKLELLETGVKVIDFYSPLPTEGIVYIGQNGGAESLILLNELLWRFTVKQKLTAVVLYERFKETPDSKQYFQEFLENFGKDTENPKLVPFGFISRAELQTTFSKAGANEADIVVIISHVEPTIRRVRELVTRANLSSSGGNKKKLFFIVSKMSPPVDADTALEISGAISVTGSYPALDPWRSYSKVLDNPQYAAQRDFRDSLARRIRGLTDVYDNEDEQQLIASPEHGRAWRVMRFGTQPLFTVTKATGVPGVWVSLSDTLNGFRQIEAGKFDAIAPTFLYNIGPISDAELKLKELDEEIMSRETTR